LKNKTTCTQHYINARAAQSLYTAKAPALILIVVRNARHNTLIMSNLNTIFEA